MTNKILQMVLERSEYCCEYCGGKEQMDGYQAPLDPPHHIIFKSQGGKDELSNLILLCRVCHNKTHGIQRPKITREELFQIIGNK